VKREEILTRLLRIGRQIVPELGDGEIDTSKSYRDLGISSLDLMEILAAAMKELKIKIPSAELSEVTTLNGLADTFVKFSA
jgi:acyl carrier protein